MNKVFVLLLGIALLGAAAIGARHALAQGTLTASLGSPPPAVSDSGQARELMRVQLSASGGSVVAQKLTFQVSDPDFSVSQYYLLLERNNALVDVRPGGSSELVFNGLPVSSGDTETLVLKADVTGPSSGVAISLTGVELDGGSEMAGLPLVGPMIQFEHQGPVPEPYDDEDDGADDDDGEEMEHGIEPEEEDEDHMTDEEREQVVEQVNAREEERMEEEDDDLVERLKGNILLQVEEAGEAWYLEIDSLRRYYLADGSAAYQALREFGLGITNADLALIPVGLDDRFVGADSDQDGLSDQLEAALGTDPAKADSDGDGFDDGEEIRGGYNPTGTGILAVDTASRDRLRGRILIQVESHGEAWYLNPKDGKRYYMPDGDAAYEIMRFLSLGVANADLNRIRVGALGM